MPIELTDAQREAAYEKEGLFVVKACPGSGKTLTVAARISRLHGEWRHSHAGIAALSFTNVAWREIEEHLSRHFGHDASLGWPHFIGTIDSFVNRFIFLPFGHRVMGCSSRPALTGPPHDDVEPIGKWLFWPKSATDCWRYCRLNSFSYCEDGRIALAGPDKYGQFSKCTYSHRECTALKAAFNSNGFATQADANYFAMKLLEENPELAAALACRFPVIIVDEAQDTSKSQMRILEALIRGGVKEMMLVGDPLQAIYEWREAEPALFDEKFNAWRKTSVVITENWRSTQGICDIGTRLAGFSVPMISRRPEMARHDCLPILYAYRSEGELPELLEQFCTHCEEHGISQESVSVLTRSRELLDAIIRGSAPATRGTPWRDKDHFTRPIAHARYLFDRGDYRGALRLIERVAYQYRVGPRTFCRENMQKHIQEMGIGAWRGQLFRVLSELPQTDGAISSWLSRANAILEKHALLAGICLQMKRNRRPNRYSGLTFDDVFGSPPSGGDVLDPHRGTIHSAKGAGLDAVFLGLRSKGAKGRKYTAILGADLRQEEELRVIYVGVTRARKAIGIAVPAREFERWQAFLVG